MYQSEEDRWGNIYGNREEGELQKQMLAVPIPGN